MEEELNQKILSLSKELQQKVMSLREMAETFRRAMEEKKPICHVCVGDGEMFFISHQEIPMFQDFPAGLKIYYPFIADYRDEVLNGILSSDIIGIFQEWLPTAVFFDYHSIPVERYCFCDGYIGRGLHYSGLLYTTILKNKRVYLLGNEVHHLLPFLEKYQIELAGHTKVNNFQDIPRIKDCLSKADFDFALLSAGLPTLVLSPWIKRTLGRCALDFGGAIRYLQNTMDLIGVKPNDLNIYNPDAQNRFALPGEV